VTYNSRHAGWSYYRYFVLTLMVVDDVVVVGDTSQPQRLSASAAGQHHSQHPPQLTFL